MTPPGPSRALLDGLLAVIRQAADADRITRAALHSVPGADWLAARPPGAVLAFGKASVQMARAAEAALGPQLSAGLILGPQEFIGPSDLPGRFEAHAVDHPRPTSRNVEAARRVARFVEQLEPGATLLCLISGGGSAHLALPVRGVSLEDIASVSSALMRAGATIRQLNAVRKHCEQLKGGGLARRILERGAGVICLIMSDVVGDPPDVISSGPLSPDTSTYADALAVLDRFGCRHVSPPVAAHLEAGRRGEIPETLKADDPLLADPANLRWTIIANHQRPARAVATACAEAGYDPRLTTGLEGPASEIGRRLAQQALAAPAPAAIVLAGEWTVDASGAPPGAAGGPSQELALAAAIGLDGRPDIHVVAYSTDGVDGPTDAAGAIIDGTTCRRARLGGLDPAAALAGHDSGGLLGRLGATIPGGPAGTNLNHVAVAIIGAR
ncbi:MAG: glycerate kinase [Phycisphaerales bacterium JB039]